MSLKVYEFDTTKEMEFFLQGGVRGGKVVVNQWGRLYGLHGKTLIFTTPAATITFSDPTGAGLTYEAISDQIRATATTLFVFWRDKIMHIQMATPTAAVVVDKDGTANSTFGFSGAKDHAGQYFTGPSGSVPRLIETGVKPRRDGFYVIVEV